MRGWRAWLFWGVVVLVVIRLAIFIVATSGPRQPGFASARDPEEVSQRKARAAEQNAKLATLLDATPRELEEKLAFDDAKRSAASGLRSIASDATSAGATSLAYAAMELSERLSTDLHQVCAHGGTKKLDDAMAALDPEKRRSFEDRVAIALRNVATACKRAPRPNE